MSIVSEIKKLVREKGGTPSGNTTAALLDDFLSAGGGEGTDLPAVTASDNGDVLTVVDGAWDKASPSGGGGFYIVDLTQDPTTEVYGLDKTWGEIKAAYDNGQVPILIEFVGEDPDPETGEFASTIFFNVFQELGYGYNNGNWYSAKVNDDTYMADATDGFLAFSD